MGTGFLGEGLIGSNFLQGLFSNAFSPDLSKKTSIQTTTSTQSTYAPVYAPTINRSYDLQYNIASGYNSAVSTKKESQVSQTPTVSPNISPSLVVIPSTQQAGSGSGTTPISSEGESAFSSLMNNTTGIIIVGIIVGGVYLYASRGKGK